MAGNRKKRGAGTVSVSVTLSATLAERLNKMLADLRAEKPYQFVSRSSLISWALAEWIELCAPDPEPEPLDEPEPPAPRRRTRPQPEARA